MKYKTYKIQKGDTLESISEKLSISLFELRNFHNNYCELTNLIADKLPSHLKEILYLPVSEITRQNLSGLKQENCLSLVLNPSLQKTTYYVSVTSYERNKENSLSCIAHIQWLQRNVVRITKEDFLLNHTKTDLMAERLAEKLNRALYPLELFLDNSGKIFSISNYGEIKNRWEFLKKEIREYFAGEELEKFIQLNESVIAKEPDVLNQIKKDWFLHSFFTGIYTEHKVNENAVSEKYFPVLPSVPPIKYSVGTQIEDQQDKQKVKLSFTGTITDTRNRTDLEKENYYPPFSEEEPLPQQLEGNYNSWYLLDYDHYKINSMFVECSLLLEKEHKVQVRAFKLPEPEMVPKEEGMIVIGNTRHKEDTNKKSFLFD